MKLRTWLLIPIICSPFFWGSTAIAKNGVAIPLPDKRVAVLSEGDLESASVGTYSVAIFKNDTFLDFIAGGVFSRDGSIFQDNGKPRVEFTDINGDGNKELIVSQLTAGSGNYLRVDAFSLGPDSINKVLSIQSDTKIDYISLLKELCEICLPIDAPPPLMVLHSNSVHPQ